MNDLRTAAQQALEAWDGGDTEWFKRAYTVMENLRATLAQQDEPVLVQGELPPRYVARSPIQAEPVEPVAWVGDPSTQDYASTQPEPDAYGYASRLAVAIWEKHYKDIAPQWKPLDDLMGVLTQIDNMTSGLTLLAQQAEPKPMPPEQRQRWEELAAMPQQAEPLNLADPAVRKRLATQWGYVPAAQAEPVEPVAALIAQRDALLEALKSTGLFLHHCWCDVQMNGYSFEKLNRQMEIVDAAIKAVEEGK